MATHPNKALRIGVIQGGKVVEETLVRGRQPVTVGDSARNTVAVPAAGLPESVTVFTPQGEQWTLAFDDATEGRVQGPSGTADFGALKSQGLARKQGDRWVIPIGEDQHGRMAMGEVTLLWQFVVPPPEAPRPVLPEAARGNRFRSLDRLFVTVLAFSLAAHVSAYVALARIPAREEATLEEIPDRFARLLVPEKKPEPLRKREEKAAQPVAEPKKEEKKEEPRKAEEDPAKAAARQAERAAQVAKAVQSKGILRVLGALGPGTGGAVADVFGSGGGLGDVASALSGAGGVAVATDPGAVGGRKGGGQGGTASIGDLATGGGGQVGYGARSEARVSGSVAAEQAEVDSSDVDQGKLGAFVRARIGLIKACYESQLKRNPKLKGKIRIRFTILETGGLADVAAVENSLGSAEVAACIVGTMRGWRTPFRPSGTVTVEYPFVFSAQ
jgi:outer membrane biosynthesis protein TonB